MAGKSLYTMRGLFEKTEEYAKQKKLDQKNMLKKKLGNGTIM